MDKGLERDIQAFEGLIDDFSNGSLGTLQFMMDTKAMIERILRITENTERLMVIHDLDYRLDKLILMDNRLDLNVDKMKLGVRDIADEVIETMYTEEVM